MTDARSRLIVALDVPERDRVLALAKELAPHVGMVKVGLEAFIAHGPGLVGELKDLGVEIFLDLKVHDIPRTAEAAAREAGRLGVQLVTVHASGGREMIAAAREGGGDRVNIIAVTMLTSLDDALAIEAGYGMGVAETARTLGSLALDAGAHGLVCSGQELVALGPLGGTRVVPGVRPAGASAGDQKRVVTPGVAIRNGASWIVMGRPIVQAEQPAEVARSVVREIAGELT